VQPINASDRLTRDHEVDPLVELDGWTMDEMSILSGWWRIRRPPPDIVMRT
jgi:hypothetical protein